MLLAKCLSTGQARKPTCLLTSYRSQSKHYTGTARHRLASTHAATETYRTQVGCTAGLPCFLQPPLQCYTTPVDADVNSSRQRCKWMRLGGVQAEHSEPLRPAYLTALTPKTKKRALSRLRLSHAPVRATREHTSQDSLYSSRICTRCDGCDKGVVDDDGSTGCLIMMPLVASDTQNHASTIDRCPSLPELMAAVYDRSPAMAVLEYVFEATKFVSGHRQGSRAVK